MDPVGLTSDPGDRKEVTEFDVGTPGSTKADNCQSSSAGNTKAKTGDCDDRVRNNIPCELSTKELETSKVSQVSAERCEHAFKYQHEEESEGKGKAHSIFDVHRKQLHSVDNQRQSPLSSSPVPTEAGPTAPPQASLPLLNRRFVVNFRPSIYTVWSDSGGSGESDSGTGKSPSASSAPIPAKARPSRKQLYDYRDADYLEKRRRTRRRKRSEVDIEVGLRLSRFVAKPYEGAVDKYSGGAQRKPKTRQQQRVERVHDRSPATTSSDESPVGSFRESRVQSAANQRRAYEDDQFELRSFLRSQGGSRRRRSVSVSPTRSSTSSNSSSSVLRTLQQRSLTGSQSHRSSPTRTPGTSPQGSAGPSSPQALRRYRKSTFDTIWSLSFREEKQSLKSFADRQYLHTKTDQLSNSTSQTEAGHFTLPAIAVTTSDQNDQKSTSRQHQTLAEVCQRLSSERHNQQIDVEIEMTKGGKTKKQSSKGKSPQPPSPATLQKRVLLNTSMPAGSPTFQRAMKGLKPEEPPKACGENLLAIPPSARKKPRVRISSAGGKGSNPGKRSPLTFKPSHRRPPSENDVTSHDCDATMTEIRDRLGNLGTRESPMPIKSILKNRRRSIDDLDVGTKKGLSEYLKSKQMEGNKNGLLAAAYR